MVPFMVFSYYLFSMSEGNLQKTWKNIISLESYTGCQKINERQMRRQIDKAGKTWLLRGENKATNKPFYIHRKRGKESNVSQMTLHLQEIILCVAASLLPAAPLPSSGLELTGPQCVHRETGEQIRGKGTETAEDREIQ